MYMSQEEKSIYDIFHEEEIKNTTSFSTAKSRYIKFLEEIIHMQQLSRRKISMDHVPQRKTYMLHVTRRKISW